MGNVPVHECLVGTGGVPAPPTPRGNVGAHCLPPRVRTLRGVEADRALMGLLMRRSEVSFGERRRRRSYAWEQIRALSHVWSWRVTSQCRNLRRSPCLPPSGLRWGRVAVATPAAGVRVPRVIAVVTDGMVWVCLMLMMMPVLMMMMMMRGRLMTNLWTWTAMPPSRLRWRCRSNRPTHDSRRWKTRRCRCPPRCRFMGRRPRCEPRLPHHRLPSAWQQHDGASARCAWRRACWRPASGSRRPCPLAGCRWG